MFWLKNFFFAAECPLAPSGRPPDRQPQTVRENKIPSGNLFLVIKYEGEILKSKYIQGFVKRL